MSDRAHSLSGELVVEATALQVLKDDWYVMLAEMSQVEYYHTWRWSNAALESGLISADRFGVWAIKDAQNVLAVVPLEFGQQKWGWFSVKRFSLPSNDHLILKDGVFSENLSNSDRCLSFWPKYFIGSDSRKVAWDLLTLDRMPDSSHFQDIAACQSAWLTREQIEPSAVLECSASMEENLSHISGRFLRNLRRVEKKANQLGELTFEVFQGPDETQRAVNEFIEIENNGWKKSTGTSIASSSELIDFYTEVAKIDEFGVKCRIHLLKLDGVCIAGHFGFVSATGYHLLKVAYNEELSNIGPGNLLLLQVVRDLSQDPGISRINLVTNPEWANKWCVKTEPVWLYTIYNKTVRGAACFALYKLKNLVKKLVVRSAGIDKTGSVD